MGSKQTKFDAEYLPQTPKQQPITIQTEFGPDLEDILDPRSPHICRTPLNEITQKHEQNYYQIAAAIPAISTEQPVGLLRKRFFKGFSYSLNDPRSPSVFMNRTPLVFDETVNLDDTFSDLFVETKIPRVEGPPESEKIDAPKIEENHEIAEKEEEQKTEEEQQQQIEEAVTPKITKSHPEETTIERDPRSPSIGVDRTPIILNDDDAPDEEDMIEAILSTLSLNQKKMPTNKPLDRIKNKKAPSKRASSPIRRETMMIYNDQENCSTPAKATRGIIDSPSAAAGKRTPLSCLKNNPQFRSKSVEVSGKTLKPRLPLTSFDDTLHKITPVKKILRYSNMENIENSFEF
ncbi:microtubule-associated protein 1B [Episyrphus balteatus]|uniref:microtubule-associated protein 1B n=1 Tax=Episyrphus balteatus TaxID=286459 RepID=UPI002484ECF5|nr:microtubule-associated protein 1B [Episyrphus balteatus]